MDIAAALDKLTPGAAYEGSLTANTWAAFDALRWKDTQQAKPPREAVAAEIARQQAETKELPAIERLADLLQRKPGLLAKLEALADGK